jgi:hypothetical protein
MPVKTSQDWGSSRYAIDNLVNTTKKYLHETLGVACLVNTKWTGTDGVPFLNQGSFHFYDAEVLDCSFLLAVVHGSAQVQISDVEGIIEKVQTSARKPAVFVKATLESYERKLLIEQKIPFLIPGNQLYLPFLAMDLRENFGQRVPNAELMLSPSAQALLIAALVRKKWEKVWNHDEAAVRLKYTPITLLRVLRELTAASLVTVEKIERSHRVTMNFSKQETWNKAKPLMRSPILQTVWTSAQLPPDVVRLAGLSALSSQSLLAKPRQPVYAINRTDWLKIGTHPLQADEPSAYELQLWNYCPQIQTGSDLVDPLSLILSLRENNDKRIQSALDWVFWDTADDSKTQNF